MRIWWRNEEGEWSFMQCLPNGLKTIVFDETLTRCAEDMGAFIITINKR